MRILVLSWEYPPYVVGGMGKHVAGLIPALCQAQSKFGPLEVDVLTTRYAGGPEVERLGNGVTVYRLEMPPFDPMDLYNTVVSANEIFVTKAHELAKSRPYDVVHVHDWLAGVAGVRIKYDYRIPLIVTIHATERGRHQGHVTSATSSRIDRLESQLCHEAWRVIVCSRYMVDELAGFFGTPADKISVIHNGIDLQTTYPCTPDQRTALRRQYAPNGERLLFFVGRIVHEKGLHVLIRAMPAILADFPNTRLLVAGKNSRHLWPLAVELRVAHAIHFLDFISDERRDCLYQVVDAAIFPSLYEPFGIVALEAMSLGCNVIVSDVGGLREVVRHEETGLTVYPGDPESIAWAVRRLFLDPDAAALRRLRAQAQAQQLYNWNKIAQQTVALYDTVVSERLQTVW